MRLLAAYIAACLAAAGCAPPNNAATGTTSNDLLTFPVGPSYTPTPPIDGTTETITFTVMNNSTDGTAVNNIPYVINKDNVFFSQASIATIPAGGTFVINFTDLESDGASHTYEIVLDPNDTTGAASPPSNTQSVVVPWQPSSSG